MVHSSAEISNVNVLPMDVLALLIHKRLLIDGLVATAGFYTCALVNSEWRRAVLEVGGTKHRLLYCAQSIGQKPTDARHGGELDGPKAVCPLMDGGVVVADTRNGRCRRVSRHGALMDDGNEMGVQLPDCVAVQPLDNGDTMIWATNRGSGPMALAHGPLGKVGRLGRGISLPKADGSRRRVEGLAYSRELGVRLLLFRDHVEASAVDADGQEVRVEEQGQQEEKRRGEPGDEPGHEPADEQCRLLDADGLIAAFGYGELSGSALCITAHGSDVYVGDGGRHAILVFSCTRGCKSAKFVRQLGSTGGGSPAFREPIGVAVGRSKAVAPAAGAASKTEQGGGARALVHVADWDRLYVLTLSGEALQVIPIAGHSTRRLNGICIDADDETVWVVSAERSALLRFSTPPSFLTQRDGVPAATVKAAGAPPPVDHACDHACDHEPKQDAAANLVGALSIS